MSLSNHAMKFDRELCQWLCSLAEQAGSEIMRFYQADMGIQQKADASPITLADKASHALIEKSLHQRFPQIPLVSEEGHLPDPEQRLTYESFWLVDPLDGTKEFIKRNGEFTVNIALVRGSEPVLGVVHAPTEQKTYVGMKDKGAWMRRVGESLIPLMVTPGKRSGPLKVAVSRSHPNEKLSRFLEIFPGIHAQEVGSSLKFCRVAEGTIDFYPRFGPLNEWDTAAAHVVAEQSGAIVSDLSGQPLLYNKPEMRHSNLLVSHSTDTHRAVIDFVNSMDL